MVIADHDNNVSGQPSLPEESSCGAFKYRQFPKRHTDATDKYSTKLQTLRSNIHRTHKIQDRFLLVLVDSRAFVDFIWFWMFLFGSGGLGWFRMVSVDFR